MNIQNRRSGFVIASMICGICSLVMCCFGPMSLILGSLSVLFALLPYRKGETRDPLSSTGLVSGIVGMILGIISCILLVANMLYSLKDPEMRQQLDQAYENIYGEDFNDYVESQYGIRID